MTARLWLVSIDEADWDYDRFERAVVWATSAEDAEQVVREAVRERAGSQPWIEQDELWIESPAWRLHAEPAPTDGVALVHWHAG